MSLARGEPTTRPLPYAMGGKVNGAPAITR